jgi:hypothetical protein
VNPGLPDDDAGVLLTPQGRWEYNGLTDGLRALHDQPINPDERGSVTYVCPLPSGLTSRGPNQSAAITQLNYFSPC